MRSCIVVAALTLSLAACHRSVVGHQAEVLPTLIPGVVLAAKASHHECVADGCLFRYRLRLTNPMDRDIHIKDCRLVDEPLQFPNLGGPAGVGISANATVTFGALAQLPIEKEAAKGLRGSEITCTGLDWHGDPPV